jgi:hypothetical protein
MGVPFFALSNGSSLYQEEKRGQTTFILRMAENGGRLRFSVSHFSDLK